MERKIHFRENWLILLGILGEAEIIFRIWGAKGKFFHGAEDFSFRDLWRSMHDFQGSREHRPPWGRCDISTIHNLYYSLPYRQRPKGPEAFTEH